MSKMINTFDIDGVIFMGKYGGIFPGPGDAIITGRSFEEAPETSDMLKSKGINNAVFYNKLKFDEKTRETSGIHKAETLLMLEKSGYTIGFHVEDDPIQVQKIKELAPHINVVYMHHDLVEKENVRHDKWDEE